MNIGTMELHFTLLLILIVFIGYLIGYFTIEYKYNPQKKVLLILKWFCIIICFFIVLGDTQIIMESAKYSNMQQIRKTK